MLYKIIYTTYLKWFIAFNTFLRGVSGNFNKQYIMKNVWFAGSSLTGSQPTILGFEHKLQGCIDSRLALFILLCSKTINPPQHCTRNNRESK
jgi:hypothetical protein